MKRPLITLHALLACSAALCQSAGAAAIYTQPDPANALEHRIESVRNGAWSTLLQPSDLEGQQLAKSSWKNGGGHAFKNSRGGATWKNGGGAKWSNSRPSWRNAGYYGGWGNGHAGWRNGSGTWKNGGGGFINW